MGGARPQWDVPQAIVLIPQSGNYGFVVLQDFHVIVGEDGNAVVVAGSTRVYE